VLWFGVLGPLEVAEDGAPVALGGNKERQLLALLLACANTVVSTSALAEDLWGGHPPATATKSLQTHVVRLRRALEPRRPAGEPPQVLATAGDGYVLHVRGLALDALAFEALVVTGRKALDRGDPTSAATALRQGLALWRGEAYAGLGSHLVDAEAARLEELRLTALEDRIEADLALGRASDLVAELEHLVGRHPLRERLWAHLMVGLYRAERQSEALRAGTRLRRLLQDELGLDPGPAVVELEQAILRHDPSLERPADRVRADAVSVRSIRVDERTPFVGRDDELARLEALSDQAAGGTMRAVFIGGEPGVGKTRLAAAVSAHAQASGATVVYGACDEEPGLPYQPVAEAIDAVVATAPDDLLAAHVASHGGELVRLVPGLSRRLLDVPPPVRSEPAVERHLLFEAATGLLAAASRRAPLVMVLDDLHWAAPPALSLLRHLLARTADQALLVVGTFRDTELHASPPLRDLLGDLRRQPAVERLPLGGLDTAAVGVLVEGATGEGPAKGELARRLHERTNGNPFFLGELLRHATSMEDGSPALALLEGPVPAGVRDVIERRLARLSSSGTSALAAAAVLGHVFSFRALADVVSLDTDELLDALDELVAARLLIAVPEAASAFRFTHVLVRQSVLHGLSSPRRALLHRRIGEVLERLHPGAVGVLAHHFSAAGSEGPPAKAAAYELEAARTALDALADEEVLDHVSRGLAALELAEAPDPTLRTELLLARGTAELRCDSGYSFQDTAWQAASEARAACSPHLLVAAAILYGQSPEVRLVRRVEDSGETPVFAPASMTEDHRFVALTAEALEVLGADDAVKRSQLLSGLANYRWSREGQMTAARQLSAEALQLARDAGDAAALTAALAAQARSLPGPGETTERLELAQDLAHLGHTTRDPAALVHAAQIRLRVAIEVGDLAAFDRSAAHLHAAAEAAGSSSLKADAVGCLVLRALIDGRVHDIGPLAAEMMAVAPHSEGTAGAVAGQLFELLRLQGRTAETVPFLEEMMDAHSGVDVVGRAAVAYAEFGRTEAAKALLERLGSEDFKVVAGDRERSAGLGWLAEAAARVRDASAATALLELLEPHTGQLLQSGRGIAVLGAADRFLGMCAATCHRWDDAERWYHSALTFEESVPTPPNAARTRLWWARMLLDRRGPGDAARSRELLQQALTTSSALDLTGISNEATELLARAASPL
jgi:DNA-binding SARP family transcriptional activator